MIPINAGGRALWQDLAVSWRVRRRSRCPARPAGSAVLPLQDRPVGTDTFRAFPESKPRANRRAFSSPAGGGLADRLTPPPGMARPEGFEPSTCGLKVRCSTGLSYGRDRGGSTYGGRACPVNRPPPPPGRGPVKPFRRRARSPPRSAGGRFGSGLSPCRPAGARRPLPQPRRALPGHRRRPGARRTG